MNLNGKSVAFHTLGCKLNFAETSTIARDFAQKGFETVAFDKSADVYLINTCSVTRNADKECRSIVNKAMRQNPDAFVVVVGCYAQLQPGEIAAMDGVDLVLGAAEKFKVTDYLNDLTKADMGTVHSCEIAEVNHFVSSFSIGERTRAFLKVQDGCDYKCTYCTIPLARGSSRSDNLQGILENARNIANQNIKEIVLTGVNIGDYGKGENGDKKHEHTFFELVRELDKINHIDRIRISSIEPNLLKDETIRFVAQSERFVPHFHIPLQSGSNHILKKMKRRYLRELYADRVKTAVEAMPHVCIGVDVIVGFPGESDEHFLETYRFIQELPIAYLHVFTYSERPDTEAANMAGVVPMATRKKRNKMLRVLSAKKRRAFYESQLNTNRRVLFEGENKSGWIYGYTENYIQVKTHWNPALVNTVHRVHLSHIDDDGAVRVADDAALAEFKHSLAG